VARLCYCWCHCSIPLAAGILHALVVGVFAGVAAILAEFLALLLMLGPINPLNKINLIIGIK
jgi:hypothetical protein